MELWDEEMGADVHGIGALHAAGDGAPLREMEPLLDEIERARTRSSGATKFLVALAASTRLYTGACLATARKYPGLSVLQIDAHRTCGDSYMGTKHNHALRMRRSAAHARLTQSASASSRLKKPRSSEAEHDDVLESRCATTRSGSTRWSSRLGADVYLSIDVDGMDPSIMPARGRPKPGGLSWPEITKLVAHRRERRRIVSADIVELSRFPGCRGRRSSAQVDLQAAYIPFRF